MHFCRLSYQSAKIRPTNAPGSSHLALGGGIDLSSEQKLASCSQPLF
jgi:hypothetical protein